MKKLLLVLFASSLGCLSASAQPSGIEGSIVEIIGNQLPGTSNKILGKGVKREICIYELTQEQQAQKQDYGHL